MSPIIAVGAALSLALGASSVNAARQDADGPALFVANKRGNTVSRIDLSSGEEVLRRESCTNPHELATSPDGKHVALACYGGTTIDIFSADTLERAATIDLGDNARPHGIVWMPEGTIYATAEGRESLFRIADPLSGTPRLREYATGQQGSHMIAVAPDEGAAWTTDLGSRTVTRVDLVSGSSMSATVGEEPEGIALTPDGQTLWVSARGSNTALALDPETLAVRQEVETGRFPLRLAIRPQGDFAVTSDLMDGSLSVIDLDSAKLTRTIAVSSPETAQDRFQVTILWSDDGNLVYVAETASDTIAEVDFATGTVLRRLSAGDGGDGLAIVP